ncbi:hypothetical protein JAO78_015050 [Alishewanella sp. 16-MA]|uniref:Uncharacterized protein n=1 Tax=Alishewanella maricola TaxID=2795740 RepID=A0ABS8C763_9ALTE|nr:hypothetical protein [Alishewanella maricola]MCB5228127.1 hypothetical protein [Alishewanella maricola]
MKVIRFFFLLALFSGSGFVLLPLAYDSASFFIYQHTSEAIVRMHMRFIPDEKYNQELSIAIEEDDIELANQIYEIGTDQNVTFNEGLIKSLEDKNSTWSTFSRNSRQAWQGAITGDVSSGAGFAGAVASDFTGISDFRDLAIELDAYPNYDSFTVGLSLVGITATALTVSSFTNAGASALAGITARVGTTSLKVIRTSGKLSKKLETVLKGHTDKIINKQVIEGLSEKIKSIDLKTADTKELNELYVLAKKTVNVKAIKPLAGALNDIRVIRGNSGFVGLSRGLTVADDLTDLSRLSKLSAVTKAKFAGVIKLAPKLAKPISKILRVLIEAIAFLFGSIVWLVSVLWYLVKLIKFIVARIFNLIKSRSSPVIKKSCVKLPENAIDGEQS